MDGLAYKGQPYVKCPECGALNVVYLRGTYVQKKAMHKRCKSCGFSWYLTSEQAKKIREEWEARQQRKAERQKRKQNQSKESPKPSKKAKQVKQDTPEPPKDAPKKKSTGSWLEAFL